MANLIDKKQKSITIKLTNAEAQKVRDLIGIHVVSDDTSDLHYLLTSNGFPDVKNTFQARFEGDGWDDDWSRGIYAIKPE
jgi:hypothetical protein